MKKICVYHFDDYRDYLKAVIEGERAKNPRLTYTLLAKRWNLKSNTSLIKILRKQRHAGPVLIRKIFSALNLVGDERRYFLGLVNLEKTNSSVEDLLSLKSHYVHFQNTGTARVLSENEFLNISQWWHAVIRQIVKGVSYNQKNFIDEVQKLFIFPVRKKMLEKALQCLIDLKLIDCRDNIYSASDESWNTSSHIPSAAIKIFHEGMLVNALKSLHELEINQRFLSGYTLKIDSAKYKEAYSYLDSMLDEFNRRFSNVTGNQVYQVQVQLFPLTQIFNLNQKESFNEKD